MFDVIDNYMVNLTDLGDPKVSSGVALLDIVPRVSIHATSTHQDVALLDSATTHMILQDPLFFNFFGNQTKA